MTLAARPFAAREFPDHVVEAVEQRRWGELERALANGLPGGLYSEEYGMSLLEFVLSNQESLLDLTNVPDRALPLSLLNQLLAHGADAPSQPGRLGFVGLALQSGQWGWAHHLMSQGWPAEAPGAEEGSIHALLRGVTRRKQLRALISMGQVMQEILEPSDPAAGDPVGADGEIFFKHLGRKWTQDALRVKDTPEQCKALVALVSHAGPETLLMKGPAVRRSQGRVLPVHQVLMMQDAVLVNQLLDLHHSYRVPLPDGLLTFAVNQASSSPLRACLTHPLVQALPLEEKAAAAFAVVNRPVPGALTALEESGLDLLACRDGEGWDLFQRAAQGGSVASLLLLMKKGMDWESPRAVGPSPADLLRLNRPSLCEVFQVSQVEETDKVRLLRPSR